MSISIIIGCVDFIVLASEEVRIPEEILGNKVKKISNTTLIIW